MVLLSTTMFAAGAMARSVGFSDVNGDEWFSSGVEFVSNTGLMTGVSDRVFAPGETVNRAQLAVILERFDAYLKSEKDMMMKEGKEMDIDTIAEIVAGDDQFETLLAALQAADLVDVFTGTEIYTVFAPTDLAFDNLPEGTLDELLSDVDVLTDVLKYHVVEGKVLAEDVVLLDKAMTLQGAKVMIEVSDGKVMVNDAKVTATDIKASNGVVHVIDTVLIPATDE